MSFFINCKKGKEKMKKSGFTLVEIMIVVAIIALLAAIAVPGLLRARMNANTSSAKAALQSLVTAIESYAAANGDYPTDYSAELANVTPPYISVLPTNGNNPPTGYSLACGTSTNTAYTCTAQPVTCNTTGNKGYQASTGGVIQEIACTSTARS